MDSRRNQVCELRVGCKLGATLGARPVLCRLLESCSDPTRCGRSLRHTNPPNSPPHGTCRTLPDTTASQLQGSRTGPNSPIGQETEDSEPNHGGTRDGQYPSPEDATSDPPVNCSNPTRGANANDGSRDGVGGADRNAEVSGADQRQSPRSFGRKTPEWIELGDALAHGLHYAPAPRHGAAAHSQVTGQNHPKGHSERFDQSAGDQGRSDDTHAFLCVVCAVAKAVTRGGN